MILSGSEITKHLKKEIFIEPYDESKLNPNSYNLTLSPELAIYKNYVLDMKKENKLEDIIIIPEDGYILEPGKLYLGRTNEYTKTDKFIPMLEGRSSIGRLGLFIHVTAGFGDVGFSGFWTLEMHCIQPVKIYPNVEICQIYYHTVLGNTDITYSNGGKYQYNNGIQPSMLYKDFKK